MCICKNEHFLIRTPLYRCIKFVCYSCSLVLNLTKFHNNVIRPLDIQLKMLSGSGSAHVPNFVTILLRTSSSIAGVIVTGADRVGECRLSQLYVLNQLINQSFNQNRFILRSWSHANRRQVLIHVFFLHKIVQLMAVFIVFLS